MFSKKYRALSLNRRRFLRGLAAGSTVAIGLPALELFLNDNGNAYASGASFPKRFGLFFWGNGMHVDRWIPEMAGMNGDWELSEQLMPLASVKNKFSLLTGLEVKVPNLLAHGSGQGGFLTGQDIAIYDSESYTFKGPSIDQVIAAEIGGATSFRSIELAVEPGARGYSYVSPDTQNIPESDPALVFERLFGAGFREPGEEGTIDPSLGLRRSVLDAVMEDVNTLHNQLGQSDRIRLEQHLDSIRDLEQRIALMESDPPDYEACMRPEEPIPIPDIDGRPQISERCRVITDMIAMAYACDLTRVLSLWYSDARSNLLFPGATAGHHQLTHDEPGEQPQVNDIVKYIMSDMAYFIEKMDGVVEGDETLLDHSVFLCTSDVSNGRTHQIDEFPIIIAGNAGGRLINGLHYRSTSKENTSLVAYSILSSLDILQSSFGEGDAQATQGLSSLEQST